MPSGVMDYSSEGEDIDSYLAEVQKNLIPRSVDVLGIVTHQTSTKSLKLLSHTIQSIVTMFPFSSIRKLTSRSKDSYSNLEVLPPQYSEFPGSPQPPQYVMPANTTRKAARTETKTSWEPSRNASPPRATAAAVILPTLPMPSFPRRISFPKSFDFPSLRRRSGDESESLIAGPEYSEED